MTPDQRLRQQFPYIADLPEKPGGWAHEYEQVVDWLLTVYGSSRADRWTILGLRVYFRDEVDRDAFCEVWGATAA